MLGQRFFSDVLNLLPFAATPPGLTHVKVKVAGWSYLERKVPLSEAGTFIYEHRSEEIWSLMPDALVATLFAPVTTSSARTISLAEIEADPVLQRKFSWVLRRHFENYLKRFEAEGLIIERDKKGRPTNRAYFTGFNGKDRVHVYDTPNRKNVRRGVAKLREFGRHAWFECEGFGYDVVRQAGVWAIRIKPFYMFAKSDGKTPLPGYLRTSKATRRIKLDRNANVEGDLNFWGRFLSQNAQTINIGGPHVEGLLLDGSFVTLDVQEGGLTDGSATQDRRSA